MNLQKQLLSLIILTSLISCRVNGSKKNDLKSDNFEIDSNIIVCGNFIGYKKVSKSNFMIFESLYDFSDENGVFEYNFKDSLIPIDFKIEDRKNCMEEPNICSDIKIIKLNGRILDCVPITYEPIQGFIKIEKKNKKVEIILRKVIWFNVQENNKIETLNDTLRFIL